MNIENQNNIQILSNQIISLPNISKETCLYYIMISNIFFSIGVFIPKYLIIKFKDIYNPFNLLLIRAISIIITAILMAKSQKVYLFNIKKLPHKRWFFLKACLKFIRLICFLYSLNYIRCITCQSLILLTPLVVMTKEFIENKFHFTKIYVYCIFSSIIGNYLLISNEFINSNSKKTIKGVLLSIISLLSQNSINLIDLKFGLINYNLNNHLFYINIYILFICFIHCLFYPFKFNIYYIIINIINGVIFSIAVNFKMLYRKNISLSKKYIWLNSFRILYVFILLYLFTNEIENFNDLIGILILVIFMVYDTFPLIRNPRFY